MGVSKSYSVIDYSLLEEALRDDLNQKAPRRMAVLKPIKVTITNYPEGETITREVSNHPKREEMGQRKIPMSKVVYIEQDDFMEEPPPKYFRLKPGGEVRLRNSYVIKCEEVIKDDQGHIVELKCTADLDTLGKKPEGRKVKGIIHWVSAEHAVPIEVNIYDRLFTDENPLGHEGKDFTEFLNPNSLEVLKNGFAEPSIKEASIGDTFQFERLGYFCLDKNSKEGQLIFNRAVTLRDTWK